jgi:HTH-type transcriptional regulator / antitoxin HigA
MEQNTAMKTLTAYKELVAEQPPQAIHSEKEHRQWQRVLRQILKKPEDQMTTAEERYLETIALLIEAYEKRHFPLPKVTPLEVLAELMIAHNLRQKDLVDVFGSEAAVSYVLRGKRDLTLHQLRGLAEKFHVSPAVFI